MDDLGEALLTKVDEELVGRVLALPPTFVSPQLRQFCETVSPGVAPEFVPIRPVQGAVPSECFGNVRSLVSRYSGHMILGWSVVEWPGVFAEAEFHAVWDSPEGVVDVTPQGAVHGKGLFLRDPGATYDFERPRRIPNRRAALSSLPEVARWLDAVNAFHGYREQVVNVLVSRPQEVQAKLWSLQSAMVNARCELLLALANATAPNRPCVCGSGAKFKRCCLGRFRAT